MSQDDVDEARRADQRELTRVRQKTGDVLRAIDTAIRDPAADVETGIRLFRALEDLREECVAEGTESLAAVESIDILQRHVCVVLVNAFATQDPQSLSKFNEFIGLQMATRARLSNPVVLDLRRVPPEDLIYALLTESPESIEVFMRSLAFSPEALAMLRHHGVKALSDAVREGYPEEEAASRLRALSKEP